MSSRKTARYQPPSASADPAAKPLTPQEHYRREKQRQLSRKHDGALEAARKEYDAMLEADAARMKGGRPKSANPRRPPSPRPRSTPE